MAGSGKKRPLISVCMIAKDEEEFIGKSLRSCHDLHAEMLVADTGSSDRTREIAAEAGAQVFRIPWHNDFAAAKNAVINRAHGRWIVFVDADEWFPDGAAERLGMLIRKYHDDLTVAALNVYQTNLLSTQRMDIMDKARTIRVFRNRPTARYQYPVHEQIASSLRGRVLSTDIELLHAGFTTEVTAKKHKSERNSEILRTMLETTADNDPHRIYLVTQLGREYQRMGQYPEAEAQYRQAVSMYTQSVDHENINVTAFGSILFSYLAESLDLQKKYDEVLMYGRELEPYTLFPYADRPFFMGLAQYHLGHYPEALGSFVEAMACLEAAPLRQEYLSTDRVVLTYAGVIDGFLRMGDAGHAQEVALRALSRYPSRNLLGDLMVSVLQARSVAERTEILQKLSIEAVNNISGRALAKGDGPICLMAANMAWAAGEPGALVWAGAWALREHDAMRASTILEAIPADHASYPLGRRLQAMACKMRGDDFGFEMLVSQDEFVYQLGLRLWAGEQIDPAQQANAEVGLEAIRRVVPIPAGPHPKTEGASFHGQVS